MMKQNHRRPYRISPKHTIPLLIAAAASFAQGQTDDLATEIKSSSPTYYWSLENTFWSQVPDLSTGVVTLNAYEKDGANLNGHFTSIPSPTVYTTADYLPIMPAHVNVVPGSNAAIFGESSGALSGATRYLELTSSELGDEPLDSLNMDGNNEWSMHLVVSPDLGDRSTETVFEVGTSANSVTLTVDVDTTTTTYRLTRTAQGSSANASITVSNAVSTRQWNQVIVTCYEFSIHGAVTQRITLDVDGSSNTAASTTYIPANTAGDLILGIDPLFSGLEFNGAAHHLAFWDRSLTAGEISNLQDSLTAEPTPRDALEIDWDAETRFNVWAIPTRDDTLDPFSIGTRNLRNWNDPIWERDGMYPMVRFRIDSSVSARTDSNGDYRQNFFFPPSETTISSETPDTALLAVTTKQWVDYLEDNLQALASSKSLADNHGYTIHWHNLYTGGGYSDYSRAVGLTYNWRDTPFEWRESQNAGLYAHNDVIFDNQMISTHDDYTASELYDAYTTTENRIPFYREGMSLNAYRMSRMFVDLTEDLTTASLPFPTRLHHDIERPINFYQGVWQTGDVDNVANDTFTFTGWADEAVEDPRSNDETHWSPSATLPHSILTYWDGTGYEAAYDNLLRFYATTTNASGQTNLDVSGNFNRFGFKEYEHAISESIMKPAREYLNEDIYGSEYRLVESGDGTLEDDAYINYVTSEYGELELTGLDLSSPVLYPVTGTYIPSGPTLEPWGNAFGVDDYMNTDDEPNIDSSYTEAEIIQDLNLVFLEKAKHNINAAYLAGGMSKPSAPWIPYPGHIWGDLNGTFSHIGSGTYYRVRWQEVARIVTFGQRRGVREWLWWGWDYAIDGTLDHTGSSSHDQYTAAQAWQNVDDMELVLDALKNAKLNSADLTTSCNTTYGDDLFGIPDSYVDACDVVYFEQMYDDLNPEADITGPGFDDIPDGVVDSSDMARFTQLFTAQYDSFGCSCP